MAGTIDDLRDSKHLQRQRAENIKFLRECGENDERIAKRLGISIDTLEQTLRRYG